MGKGNPGGAFSDSIVAGAKFDRLTVIERLPREKGKHRYVYRVLCQCECGGRSTPEVNSLLCGKATSCGCRKKECGAENAKARLKPDRGRGKLTRGARFGRLVVIKRMKKNGLYTNKVFCSCDCGNQSSRTIDALVYGLAKSCGCLNREKIIARNKANAKFQRFSARFPSSYRSWQGMRARCLNKRNSDYERYGAKGIKVCSALRINPWNLRKLLGKKPTSRYTIDRWPVHNGNYTCGQCKECKSNGWKLNVRWATRRQQSENRGDFNVWLTAFGKTMILSHWQEASGMDATLITCRIKRDGWSPEKALSTPDGKGNCYRP